MQMVGVGVPSAATFRSVAVGPGWQDVVMGVGEGWEGLSKVSFSAVVGGVEMGVGIGEVGYGLVGTC